MKPPDTGISEVATLEESMSLLRNGCGLTSDELESVSPPLREKILEKYSKIQAWELISNRLMFNRDSKRLDAQTRAIRRTQGLQMPDDPDDEVVLGDKTTTLIGTAAAIVLATGILAGILTAGAIAWKLIDVMNPPAVVSDDPVDGDLSARLTPGFGTPEDVKPEAE